MITLLFAILSVFVILFHLLMAHLCVAIALVLFIAMAVRFHRKNILSRF